MAPANLSRKKAISFWARGEGKRVRLMLFTQSSGFIPLQQAFQAGEEWKQFRFELASFSGSDGRDLMAVVWGAGPDAGPFRFQIDAVRFE